MKSRFLHIIENLKNTKGLANPNLLNEDDKRIISELESKNNYGVLTALKRKYKVVLTHNNSFRKPVGKIVIKQNNKIIFPAVDFPEIKAENVVSGSPNKEVHRFLIDKFNIKTNNNEATLIIGFN